MNSVELNINDFKYQDFEDADADVLNRPIQNIVDAYNTLRGDVSDSDISSTDNTFTGSNTFEGSVMLSGETVASELRVNSKLLNNSSDFDTLQYINMGGSDTNPIITLKSKYDSGDGTLDGSIVLDTIVLKIDKISPNIENFIDLGSQINTDTIQSSTTDGDITLNSNIITDKNISSNGNIAFNTDKFTVQGNTGDTAIKGTFSVVGDSTVGILSASGDISTSANMSIDGNTDIGGTLKIDIVDSFTTDTEIGVLQSVKIGTDADNKDLTVTGEITESSDARLKENVETITNALDIVENMRGVYYNKIGSDKKEIGFIAQEVEDYLPEIVENGEEYKSVAYARTVAILVQSIKELTERVKELEEK